jgi:hypothetical protein
VYRQQFGLNRGGSILDAGCGPTLVGEALLDVGYDVVGADPSGQMISGREADSRLAVNEHDSFRSRSSMVSSTRVAHSTFDCRSVSFIEAEPRTPAERLQSIILLCRGLPRRFGVARELLRSKQLCHKVSRAISVWRSDRSLRSMMPR